MSEEQVLIKTKQKWDRADCWLIFSVLLFLITLWLTCRYPNNIWLECLHFAADAALVGGIADWFAVTAIFKHPCGLPIPNTAILPRKKKAFADGAALFVKGLLSEETVIREIRGMDILGMIAIKLKDPETKEAVISYLLDLVKDRLDEASRGENIREISNEIRQKLRTYRTKDLIRHGIAWLKEGQHGAIALEYITPQLKETINSAEFLKNLEDTYHDLRKDNVTGINSLIFTAMERFNIANIGDAAEATQSELLHLAADLGVRGSETQRKVLQVIFEKTEEIAKDKRLIRALDEFRMNLIDRLPLEDALRDIFSRLWNNFREEEHRKKISERTEQALRSHIAEVLRNQFVLVLDLLRNDADLQEDLDNFFKKMASEFATNIARPKVAKIVKRVLDNMQEEQLNEIVRSKIRDDLMFIRINGVLAGAIIGTFLFGGMQAFNFLALK